MTWRAALERALAWARASGAISTAMNVVGDMVAGFAYGPMPLDVAADRARELIDDMAKIPSASAYTWSVVAWIEAMLGRFDRGREALAESERLGREFGLELLVDSIVPAFRSKVAEAEGHLDTALEARLEVAAAMERMGERAYRSTDAGEIACLQVRRGQDDDALRWAAESRELAAPEDIASQFLWRLAEGRVLVRGRSKEQGLALVREGVALVEGTDWLLWRAHASLHLAWALVDAGRPDEALEPARTALALLQDKGAVALIPPVEALLAELGAG